MVIIGLGNIQHTILMEELKLGYPLNHTKSEVTLCHFFGSIFGAIRSSQGLGTGKYNTGNLVVIDALEESIHIVFGTFIVIGRTGQNIEAPLIYSLHLISRHTQIHLLKGLELGLYCQHCGATYIKSSNPVLAQTAHQILMNLLEGLVMMPGNINLSALNGAVLHQLTPVRICHSTSIIAGENITAINSSSFAIYIQLLEGGFINRQRSDASVLGLLHDLFHRHAIAFSQGHKVLVVHNKLYGIIANLHLMTLNINKQ